MKQKWSMKAVNLWAGRSRNQFLLAMKTEVPEKRSLWLRDSLSRYIEHLERSSLQVFLQDDRYKPVTISRLFSMKCCSSNVYGHHVGQFRLLKSNYFSDGCVFHTLELTNTEITCIWQTDNPRDIQKQDFHIQKGTALVLGTPIGQEVYIFLTMKLSDESILVKC